MKLENLSLFYSFGTESETPIRFIRPSRYEPLAQQLSEDSRQMVDYLRDGHFTAVLRINAHCQCTSFQPHSVTFSAAV
jgi:regulator of sigma D